MSSTSPDARVNSTTTGDQWAPAIAKLDDGYVVVWQSFQMPDTTDIYLQRYTDAGVAVGGDVLVNTVTTNAQAQPTVTATAGGGFVVAWASQQEQSGGNFDYGVYLQRFDSQAQRLGGETHVNNYSLLDQVHPGIAALAAGGFVVTWWSDAQSSAAPGIYSRMYGADGAALGGEVRVNTASAGPQSAPTVAGLADGGYVIAWDGSSGIHAQRFDSHGTALAAETRVDTVDGGAIAKPVAAALPDGGYVIAWQSAAADGNGLDIHAQRFGADGAAAGSQSIVNSTLAGHQTAPAITAMPDGGYVIGWTSTDQDGSGDGVFAQRFDAQGHAIESETQLNTTTALNQSDVALAPANGGYIAAWGSQEPGGHNWDVFETTLRDSTSPPLRSIVNATEGNDTLVGTWEDNACLALGGDDLYLSQGGSDYFDGGTGLDTFVFPESVRQVTSYTLRDGTLTIHTSDAHNPQAVPIILATERIEFSDALFALDTQGPSGSTPAGHVWQAAALLQAAFGATPDHSALSRWTAQADASATMGVLGSKMIAAYAPGVSSASLVATLYLNVTGHAATQDVIQSYAAQIGAGKQFATQGDLFAYAASATMNTDHIAGIVGTVQQLDMSWFTAH
ncbi:MAG: uncharacterized protein JWQ07_2090 [Ramlibacter sp.]|nr:uncharacterized protein [Ramlibacter sp.]